jgi:hypothetical protein
MMLYSQGDNPLKLNVFISTIIIMRHIYTLLGDKTFFMGDQPCEVDCVLFGMVAMILYNMPGSKHQKFVRGEYINNF